jgi:hypothetical protein
LQYADEAADGISELAAGWRRCPRQRQSSCLIQLQVIRIGAYGRLTHFALRGFQDAAGIVARFIFVAVRTGARIGLHVSDVAITHAAAIT